MNNKNRQRGGRPQGRRPHGGGGGGGNSGGGNNGGMNNSHRNFDSNGPEVKVRGTATNIFERYCQLARDANSAGDRVAAENYLQHAEHYYRIMLAQGVTPMQRAANQQQAQQQPNGNSQQPAQSYASATSETTETTEGGEQPSLEMELEAALDSNGDPIRKERDEATAA